ncbi:contact-dependent growth inhibition system immunity protein [Vibrio gazogenes]|uniref:CdiI immunity protein domain-containing protein n=1 Tax=Vibrio gazogenes TaxID=687 RepID=A0A1Z2SLA4_VIBGA|nr:contact-dependent growth inhibition system immunity protein [Vibrio gazogenes]ASA57925.1 hypothetical protein BSQ33_19645 [Vibrio gazogenes]
MDSILRYLAEAYFHQDWRYDHTTSKSLMESFVKCETEDTVHELYSCLLALRETDDLPQSFINDIGGSFRPESEGMSSYQWIDMSLSLLLSDNDESTNQ